MNFKDIGIIIAKKPLQENCFIITLFTENHGLYSTLVRQSSKKSIIIYQEGNIVDFLWQARLHEHLGFGKCELIKSYTGSLITNKTKLYAFNSIISIIKIAFHERENHNNFFPVFAKYLHNLADNFVFEEYIRFELAILQESGYSLDLSQCAVTGSGENLHYVSPKSGRAISLSSGLPYHNKLLILPKFLTNQAANDTIEERNQALQLTSYFFNRYLFRNNQQPIAREKFIDYVSR